MTKKVIRVLNHGLQEWVLLLKYGENRLVMMLMRSKHGYQHAAGIAPELQALVVIDDCIC